ncbi:hypothetical protein HQ531_09515 [bacterium]|nr:hypothetical protein [bacterium]
MKTSHLNTDPRQPALRIIVYLLLVLNISGSLSAFEYLDHPDNPIFNGSHGWDGLALISPRVLYEDSIYKMWFAGRNVGLPIRIGYAVSNDGVSWTETGSPILEVGPAGSFDSAGLKRMSVVHDPSGYKMWYTGVNGAGIHQIGLATSPDGVSWTKYNQNPVVATGQAGSWFETMANAPSVFKIGGAYHMWFVGANSSGEVGIGYAHSFSGINWIQSQYNPVLVSDPESPWETVGVSLPDVVQLADGSFVMFYMGYDGFYRQIGMARSTDGINWIKSPNNPIIQHGEPGSWNEETSSGPCAVSQGPGQYMLWYTGNATSGSTTWAIGQGTLSVEIIGDLTGDAQVDIGDILELIEIILEFSEATDYQLLVGDLYGDNLIDVSDLVMLVELAIPGD